MVVDKTKRLILISSIFVFLFIERYIYKFPNQYNNGSYRATDSKVSKSRSIRILSLGGSITYGSKLESRQKSYPYGIFKEAIVANIAMRATGPEYSSKCIQSMVDEELRKGC